MRTGSRHLMARLGIDVMKGRAGSGAPDGVRRRGGLSVRKDVRILGTGVVLSNLTDRQVFAPYGLHGGNPGMLGEIILNPGTPAERKLHSKEFVAVECGDVVSFRCSGSGGVGSPHERPREQVRRDLREGLITPDVAKNVYELEVGD